jgi:flagellar operon protein
MMADILTKVGYTGPLNGTNGMTKVNRTGRDLSFSDVLRSRLELETGIKFSAHAMERLNERGITLSDDELSRLSGAVSHAEEKGVNDSLILVNDKAFIVSIKNRTVVTAMTGECLKNNVFTNIDSTILT